MAESNGTEIVSRAPRKPEGFEEAELLGPYEIESVEQADDYIEGIHCDCGSDGMEEVAVRRSRTKHKPRKHFERHFFRCPKCAAEKVVLLDVTARRRLLGV